ncbi:MAG: methylmalonyl Co-A mutase-associated GTPase MeaB [Candidatus Eisenbacteria bacterium]|nr:methylmalonyl Co-A mutase-associated GTPase MeaB [Candidatus Eisenbacteria bacterium]
MPGRPSERTTRSDALEADISVQAAILAEGLVRRERRAIARAISHVEDRTPVGRDLLDRVFLRAGRARRIGITGPPGSGKSTLVHALAMLLRKRGERVGVLAIDPTSPFTGGAILGDRVRMPSASGDDGFFVRSMASRGSLGGVSAAAHEAADVLDAAGFDWVLIETVGVGQSELEIVELADTVLLVLVPESGDAVQTMKAGIMEIADVFVINKYDREGGDRLRRDIAVTLELTHWTRPGGWIPPIVPAVATAGTGVDQALAEAEAHIRWLAEDPARQEGMRLEKVGRRLRALLRDALIERVWRDAALESRLAEALPRIAARECSPYRWIESIRLDGA